MIFAVNERIANHPWNTLTNVLIIGSLMLAVGIAFELIRLYNKRGK